MEVLAIGHAIAKAPPQINLVIYSDSMVAMQVFRKGTSPVIGLRAIVAEADSVAAEKGLVYVVRHFPGKDNPADKPSRLTLGPKDLMPWKYFWTPSRYPLQWPELIAWIQKTGNASTEMSASRALATILLTKQLRVAALDIFFKEIYSCDELFEGDAVKVLCNAFLHNIRTSSLNKNEGRRRTFLKLIANRLGSAGVLT